MISVPLDIFLHLPNDRTQEICKIIPTNLILAASDLCPQTLFISVPECDIGHSDIDRIPRIFPQRNVGQPREVSYLLV